MTTLEDPDKSFFEDYDHLKSLKSFLPTLDSDAEKEVITVDPVPPLMTVGKQLFFDLDYFMLDPLRFINGMKGASQIFEKDPLCVASEKAMNVCVDLIHENIFGDFSILQFGAGNGGGFRRFHPYVSAFAESYTATDVGKVEIDAPNVTVLNWDINKPYPAPDKSFQVIYGCHALSWSANIAQSLEHIRNCSTEGGFVLLEEFTSSLPVFFWGLSSDVWSTASDARDFGLWNTHAHWVQLFDQAGFDLVVAFDNSIMSTFLLKKRRQFTATKIVNVTSPDFACISEEAANFGTNPTVRTIFAGKGGEGAGSLALVRCAQREPEPSPVGGYQFEVDDEQQGLVPDLTKCIGAEKNLLCNVIRNNVHGSYREYRQLHYAPTDNWQIEIEKPGFLNTLCYRQALPKSCEAYYSSINFKDVMITFGRLRLASYYLGLDFSGIRDGKRVMAIAVHSFAYTSDPQSEHRIWDVPSQWTLQQAATVPTPYFTAYCCLDYKARVRKGQTVLVHGGSGAVGQAVINICLKRGIKVIASCSDSKRAFLREKFGLTDDMMCNSRDAKFYGDVMKKTNYEGVDVVVNSLAEDKLLLSLDLVKPNGHFCEIGKFDILQDNKIGMKIFEKNVSFHGVDAGVVAPYDDIVWECLQKGLQNGEVQPVTIDSVYHHSDIESAIRKVGSAKHIGKVLVQIRDDPEAAVSAQPTATSMPFKVRPHFYTSGTHIITGGLGGFGLELAEWLVQRGAEKVLCLSRSSQRTAVQARALNSLPQMQAVQVDVSNEEEVAALLKANPDTVGIWHLAVIFKDSLFKNMTEQRWKTMMDVKVAAAKHFDQYSRQYCKQLKEFVCFSSITSIFGLAGQTHYGFGNAYLEHIARKRMEQGLPGKAIIWGRIGNVGFIGVGNKITNLEEFADQHIDSCLMDMHNLLLSTSPVVSCYKNSGQGYISKDVKKVTALEMIARTLRIDPQKISNSETLTDLGVDSLQIVTIKSILKIKGYDLNVQDLYELTVGKIRDMA